MDKRKRFSKVTYTARLKVSGGDVVSSGRTAEEAILGLKIGKLTTKGVLSFEYKGKKSKEVLLTIPAIKKLFVYGLSGEIQRAVVMKKIKLLSGIE